jgi:hypothetical protein
MPLKDNFKKIHGIIQGVSAWMEASGTSRR